MPTFPGMYRANNVPKWQRLHQNHEDGLRQWDKVSNIIGKIMGSTAGA